MEESNRKAGADGPVYRSRPRDRSVFVVMAATGMVVEVGAETGRGLVEAGQARYARVQETVSHRPIVGPFLAR